MHAPHLIHALTFDVAVAGEMQDGQSLSEWLRSALLPVVDDALERQGSRDKLRRIDKLEIDLGCVSRDEAPEELARRLFAQLTSALGWSLEQATEASLVREREQTQGELLLNFLHSGRLEWSVATDKRIAHRQLLRQLLSSSQAESVLREAVRDTNKLTRLVRQFDASTLLGVADVIYRSHPKRQTVLQLAEARVREHRASESFWLELLRPEVSLEMVRAHPINKVPESATPNLGSLSENELLQALESGDVALAQGLLLRLPQLKSIWAKLSDGVRHRTLHTFSQQLTEAHYAELIETLGEVRPIVAVLRAERQLGAEDSPQLAPLQTVGVRADPRLASTEPEAIHRPASSKATNATNSIESVTSPVAENLLQQALQQGDAVSLLKMLSMTVAQREEFRSIWSQLSVDDQQRNLLAIGQQLSEDQQAQIMEVLSEYADQGKPESGRAVSMPYLSLLVGARNERNIPLALAQADASTQKPLQQPGDTHPAHRQKEGNAMSIDPALAKFRDWQQKKLDLMDLPLTLPELKQWLNWWLMHDPRLVNQDCSLMLDAIDIRCQQLPAPEHFMKLVLRTLRSEELLDLEALVLQANEASALTEKPVAMDAITTLKSHQALRNFVDLHMQEDAELGNLNSTQLHQLVRAWIFTQQDNDTPSLFLIALEAQALQAPSAHAFFRQVLQGLMQGEVIDLEDKSVPAEAGVPEILQWLDKLDDETDAEMALPDRPSPLPVMMQQALPQRLANAMLQADLRPLEMIWSDIARHHTDVMREAAQRYLQRAEVRQRLVEQADIGMLKELLRAMSATINDFVDPILRHGVQCNDVLPQPLSSDEFQRRVLGFGLTQALQERADNLAENLLQMLAPTMTSSQIGHAWRQILPPNRALNQALFGRRYLKAIQQILQAEVDLVAPPLRAMLTKELAANYPELTDALFADGFIASLNPEAFSTQEWQAVLSAQLERQGPEVREEFRQTFRAALENSAQDVFGAELQAALAIGAQTITTPGRRVGTNRRLGMADAELQRALAREACGWADAALGILLLRSKALNDAENTIVGLLLNRLLAEEVGNASGALESALTQPAAIDRLAAIVPGPEMARLLVHLQPQLAAQIPVALRAVADLTSVASVPVLQEPDAWRAIYHAAFVAADPVTPAEFIRSFVHQLAGSTDMPLPEAVALSTPETIMRTLLAPLNTSLNAPLNVPQAATARPKSASQAGEAPQEFTGACNVLNAGMVIIATYMQRLFNLLDLTQDGKFVSEETMQRAVHLLQYAVTGEETTPEYQLVLNKLFCGIHGGLPIAAGVNITDRERETIEQMLSGVIAHWSALGGTSIAGLRETFLQREGHLYFEEDAWHLKVLPGTFDMLLDRLPWSFSMIRFPWMEHPLHVTWR